MKKYVKSLFLTLVLMVGVFTLTACNSDRKLVGTWKYDKEGIVAVYNFKADKTGTYTITVGGNTVEKELTYKTRKNLLLITYKGDKDVFELEYTIKDDVLTVKDSLNENVVYQKTK